MALTNPVAGAMGYDGGMTAYVGVKDAKASIKWYQDALGFEVEYFLEDMGWAEMVSPTERVYIGLSQVENPRGEGGATLVFGVKDIDAARKRVEGMGVKFDGETCTIPDMVRLATFFDPDGNTLMFYQSLAQPMQK